MSELGINGSPMPVHIRPDWLTVVSVSGCLSSGADTDTDADTEPEKEPDIRNLAAAGGGAGDRSPVPALLGVLGYGVAARKQKSRRAGFNNPNTAR